MSALFVLLCSRDGLSWKQRLGLEDSFVGFDVNRRAHIFELRKGADGVKSHTITLQGMRMLATHVDCNSFNLMRNAADDPYTTVGMGPKLLVSDVSTSEQRTLRWCVTIQGNTAIEFGVVPVVQQVRVADAWLVHC